MDMTSYFLGMATLYLIKRAYEYLVEEVEEVEVMTPEEYAAVRRIPINMKAKKMRRSCMIYCRQCKGDMQHIEMEEEVFQCVGCRRNADLSGYILSVN